MLNPPMKGMVQGAAPKGKGRTANGRSREEETSFRILRTDETEKVRELLTRKP